MDRFRDEPDESLLDQVEPGRAGRDEVEVNARPPLQPGPDISPVVSPTVQVQLETATARPADVTKADRAPSLRPTSFRSKRTAK
jgi:hypothetical protein